MSIKKNPPLSFLGGVPPPAQMDSKTLLRLSAVRRAPEAAPPQGHPRASSPAQETKAGMRQQQRLWMSPGTSWGPPCRRTAGSPGKTIPWQWTHTPTDTREHSLAFRCPLRGPLHEGAFPALAPHLWCTADLWAGADSESRALGFPRTTPGDRKPGRQCR